MQNFLRYNFDYRRVPRWGDEASVRRAVAANFERLTKLPASVLAIACPFWEHNINHIVNYGTLGNPVVVGDRLTFKSKGLYDLGDPGTNLDCYIQFPNIVYDRACFIGLSLSNLTAPAGVVKLLDIYENSNNNAFVSIGIASTSIASVYREIGTDNGPVGCDIYSFTPTDNIKMNFGVLSNSGYLRSYFISHDHYAEETYPWPSWLITGPVKLFYVTSDWPDEGNFLGGALLLNSSEDIPVEVFDLLMIRGWELFQPTSFTDYFIGPAIDDVFIIYDPGVNKTEDLDVDLTLFAELFQTLTYFGELEIDGELLASQYLTYIHLNSLAEALTEIVFAGVFMEVLKDGLLETVVNILADSYVYVIREEILEGVGSITGRGWEACTFDMPPFDSNGTITGEGYIETTKDGTFETVAELSADWTKSVGFNGSAELNAQATMEWVFVPGGSVWFDIPVGEVATSLGADLLYGYVSQYNDLTLLAMLLADVHAEYSVTIVNGFLSVAEMLLGNVQVTNLPTTGDLRKTDLITLKQNLDLITLRR